MPVRGNVRQAFSQNYSMPQAPNLIGQVLDGRYRIEAKLGSGGMGDVYRATRLLIGDTVAIKFLHAHLASNPQAAERFRHEAVTATKLRHRNVVALYDVGISAVYNVPYLLMEIAEGLTLRQIISHQPILPLDFVVTVVAQVCAALEEAHRLGIVHRDIKPENITANQTSTGWHVKVLDFGIAKLYNEATVGLTQDGTAMGTPQYMSPEQCMGNALDARSDIYSVGIVLYEMLCGTVPFKSAAVSAIAVHQVQTAPPLPRAVNPNVSPEIEAVILRALSKQREIRHQTAQELARELIQAATVVFKSGNFSVPTIIAPPEDEQSASNSLSEEVLAEEKSEEASSEAEKTKKTTKGRKQKRRAKKNSEDEEVDIINPNGATDVPVANEFIEFKSGRMIDSNGETASESSKSGLPPEDLSLVFEDAESLLEELFPDKKHENKETLQTAEADAPKIENEVENLEISPPVSIPGEPFEPPQILSATPDKDDFLQEIEPQPQNKNLLITVLSALLFFGGLIGLGWWLLSGD